MPKSWRNANGFPINRKMTGFYLSPIQKRIYTLQSERESSTEGCLSIFGALKEDLFAQCYQAVLRRHEILRTSYDHDNKLLFPVQVIDKTENNNLKFMDWSLDDPSQVEERISELKREREQPICSFLIKLSDDNHLFLICANALSLDSVSIKILLDQVFSLYFQGPDSISDNEPLQYLQYSEWLKENLESEDGEKIMETFFSKRENSLHLPFESKEHFLPEMQYSQSKINISKTDLEDLQCFCRENELTPEAFFLCCYKILLFHLAGVREIETGYCCSDRIHEILENLPGAYTQMIPFNLAIDPKASFSDLVKKVARELAERKEWKDYYLHGGLKGKAERGKPSYMSYCFGYESLEFSDWYPSDLKIHWQNLRSENELFKLRLQVSYQQDQVSLDFQYDNNSFRESDIRWLQNCYQNLLGTVAHSPAVDIGSIQILPTADLEEIISKSTGARIALSDKSIVGLFQEIADKYADKPALYCDGNEVSYRSINVQANQLSHYLLGQENFKPEVPVAIISRPTENMIVAVLAILKAGAPYLPIDPAWPHARIRNIIRQSGAEICLQDTDAILTPDDVVIIRTDNGEARSEGRQNPDVDISPETTAYVIYTSGSTGVPKGVKITHASVMNLIEGLKEQLYRSFAPGLRIGLLASYTFDASVKQIFSSLLGGHTLCLTGDSRIREYRTLSDFLNRADPDVLDCTPTLLKLLLQEYGEEMQNLNPKLVLVGGEALTKELVTAFYDVCSEASLFNLYGPTECCVDATILSVPSGPDRDSIPIGYPLPNVEVCILNEFGNHVPAGVEGELHISGKGLMKGYINNQEATNTVLVPHWSGKGFMYKTGDLGRWLPDGSIEFTGRKDFQLKIRGYRVEPAEIEAEIRKGFRSVNEVVVSVHEDHESREKQMVAFYEASEAIDREKLREYLSAKLPEYMVPGHYVHLHKIPRTTHHKIDFQKLKKIPVKGNQDRYVAPSNKLEAQLCEAWGLVLKNEKVGISDHFFQNGGDSIKAIRLAAYLNKELSYPVEVRDIFLHPEVHSMAKFIIGGGLEKDQRGALQKAGEQLSKLRKSILDSPEYSALLPSGYEQIYPVSDISHGMIYYDKMYPDSAFYRIFSPFQLNDEDFDFSRFKKAFAILVRKHEILRSSFHLTEFPFPLMIVHPFEETNLDISYREIYDMPSEKRSAEIELLTMADRKKTFDVSKAGLWRIKVLRTELNEYLVFWTHHHAILDGWSNASLLTELSRVYFALQQNGTCHVNPVRASYKDFVVDQLRIKSSEKIKDFWKTELKGYKRTPLPFHRTNGGKKNYQGVESFSMKVPPSLNDNLQQLSDKYRVSIKDLFFSAFLYLLRFTTESEDLTVGVITHVRPEVEEADALLGCLLGTVPFRQKISDENGPLELLKSISEKFVTLRAYDKLPLTDILFAIGEKVSEFNPVFDVLFNFVDFHVYEDLHDDTRLTDAEVVGFENTNTLFDCSVNNYGKKASIHFNYASGLYSREDCKRIGGYYCNILSQFAKEFAAFDHDLILGPQEIKELTIDQKTTDYPENETLVSLFEKSVVSVRDKVAISFADKNLTYDELNVKANQLSAFIRDDFNIERDSLIGIIAEHSDLMIISILAVLKAGAAYVPIDPSYPDGRIDFVCKDAGLKLLIADGKSFARASRTGLQVVTIDDEWKPFENLPGENRSVACQSHNLAYIIYTSGSTGLPKGVMVEHRNAVSLLAHENFPFTFSQEDVWISLHSFCFDYSVWEIFGALLNRCRLVVVRREKNPDFYAISEIIFRERVTVLNIVPSVFKHLSHHLLKAFSDDSPLRYIFLGGESLNTSSLSAWMTRFPQVRLVNLYGITETTVIITYKEIGYQEIDTDLNNIGKPLPTLSLFIMDDRQSLVPAGVPGEIVVSGAGLARGYLNNSSLTEQRFIDNPYLPGQRLYLTGDKGYMTSSREVVYLGRKDKQIKLRGYRIEPGEISGMLERHNDVEGAYVTLFSPPDRDAYLIAYCIFKDNKPVDSGELRKFLSRRIPDHMIPLIYITMEFFPFNSNGKIDPDALPLPDESPKTNQSVYEPPGNEIEKVLCEIWEDVLEHHPVGVNDNFFELGGHSLKITGIIARINKTLNLKVDFRTLFSYPTVREFAKSLKPGENATEQHIPALQPQDFYDVSSAQRRLWVMHQFEDARTAYNMPGAYQVEGKLEPVFFEKAISELCRRHESLRTNFIEIDKEPKQLIHDFDVNRVDFELINLEYEKNAEDSVGEIIRSVSSETFNLEKDALFKTRLIRVNETNHYFVFILHHIIADGRSVEVLAEELLKIYHGLVSEDPVSLPKLTIQYKDYTAWHNEFIREPGMESSRQYWQSRFQTLPPALELPYHTGTISIADWKGDKLSFSIENSLYRQLKEISSQSHVSLFMAVVATLKLLFYRFSGQEDIVIGAPVSGRKHAGLKNQVGLFANLVPLRTKLGQSDSFLTLLEKVKETCLEAYEHSEYPFDMLVNELDIGFVAGRTPLFDVMVADQGSGEARIEVPEGLSLRRAFTKNTTSKYLMSFYTLEHNDKLTVDMEYNAAFFSKDLVESIISHYLTLIASVVDKPTLSLDQYAIVTKEHNHAILSQEFLSKQVCGTLHSHFEDQVKLTPKRSSSFFKGEEITYGELNEMANRIAHFLSEEKKACGGDIIALAYSSANPFGFLAAMIAIMKTGAAVLPIDTSLPSDRISFLLQDSGAKMLLWTTESQELEIDAAINLVDYSAPAISDTEHIINPENSVSPDDIAYIIYTSGSTGKPKGVRLTHANLISHFVWFMDYFNFDETDVIPQKTQLNFVDSIIELLFPVVLGGSAVYFRPYEEISLDPLSLFDWMKSIKTTIVQFVPSVFDGLASVADINTLSSLKTLILSGEPPRRTYQYHFDIYNIYGCSEGTASSTVYKMGHTADNRHVAAGLPIANTRIYVMNEALQIQPLQSIGEICLGGYGVAKGYIGSEAIDGERFIEDPFEPGSVVFKTGDLGRLLPDGAVEFVGRKDDQLKIRGIKIDPSEIESQLLEHPDIDSAFISSAETGGHTSLVAYVLLRRDLTIMDIRRYLTGFLPDYMIPRDYIQINYVPLNMNGKVDKKALKSLFTEYLPLGEEYVEARNKAQKAVLEHWRKVLLKDRLGIYDNFFQVGGDSLSVVALFSSLNKEFPGIFKLHQLFSRPTIEEQAEILRDNGCFPAENQDIFEIEF